MKERRKHRSERILQYVIPYFVGILAAIVFTPVELSLAGQSLWYWYPVLAIPAFLLLVTIFSVNSSFFDILFGCVYLISIGCVLFGIASHFGSLRQYRNIGVKLIGFPLGFIGTIGVFFISAESI